MVEPGMSESDVDRLSDALSSVQLFPSEGSSANENRPPAGGAAAGGHEGGEQGPAVRGGRNPLKNINLSVPRLIESKNMIEPKLPTAAHTAPGNPARMLSPHQIGHMSLCSLSEEAQAEHSPCCPKAEDEMVPQGVPETPSSGLSSFIQRIATSVKRAVGSTGGDESAPMPPTPVKAEESCDSFVRDRVRSDVSASEAASVSRDALKTLVIFDDIFLQHKTGKLCQECPQRLDVLCGPKGSLMAKHDFEDLEFESHMREAPLSDILRVHEWEYISELKRKCSAINDYDLKALPTFLDPPGHPKDTVISAQSYNVAATAAGACCAAVDRVMQNKARNCFVACRPPGHHAGPMGLVHSDDGSPSESQGFCLLNNVAIAAAYAKYNYSGELRRIAIVDFDVHNGDGTASCVRNLTPHTSTRVLGPLSSVSVPSYKPWNDERDAEDVFFASIHLCNPDFYPKLAKKGCNPMTDPVFETETNGQEGTEGHPNICNIAMHKTANTKECSALFRSLVTTKLIPRLAAFQPELLFISAGFDGHTEDKKGNRGWCHLLEGDYEWVTDQLCAVARGSAGGRVVSVLEGGYHVERQAPIATSRARSKRQSTFGAVDVPPGALATSCAAHVSALMRA